jgi:hypothetical protein
MNDQPGSHQRRQPLDPTKRSSFGTSPAIFISYRRDDAAGSSGRLYDRLVARFDEDRVFMDIDTIHAGEPFAVRIEEALANCAACVVVIGRTWESITTPNGSRRLDDPTDFVRLEVAGALRSGAKVFPVLVDGGSMPSPGSLPEDIRDLAGLQAIPLRGDSWNYDVGRLMLALDQALGVPDGAETGGGSGGTDSGGGGTPKPTPPRRLGPVAIGVIVALLIALAGGTAWLATRSSGTTTTPPSTTASTSPSSSVSTSGDCIAPTPPVTSGSAPRLDGLYQVDMTLTCFHGDLGTNLLWKNPDPQVGETHWMNRVWRFTKECVSGSCHAKWDVLGRDVQGVLSRSGTTYNGASPGSAHCGADPQSEQTPVTRQLQLTVSGTDGSGLATGFDGWMTISWTCDAKVSATFELAGTRTSS